ncbi:heavy-metal-associated domain-containing protein [Winogradskyella immobilis]|uniref:Heavy-metal-associated domain-containing protein n=1 Tax=Winogradskyella immobilis TaxID=2816852 RepID=A0ABS8EJT4_9FLAO|nr:heavy metal-associated domain-containing protein [Winogradskyella immobilis]MCC1483291.1 heavy-metal-associated domain-containing protein [Winogradskyella immobilis]MCG0015385.1 cation transporter [Winogradskyella immobilis]
MKTLKPILTIALLIVTVVACNTSAKPEVKTIAIESSKPNITQTLDPNASYAKVEFNIKGMTCAVGCAKTIEKKMAKMEGVKSAKVDFDRQLAMVEFDEAKVTPGSLKEAVVNVSEMYKVQEIKTVDKFSTKTSTGLHKDCKADCKDENCIMKDKK